MSRPLVTCILPTRNRRVFVGQAVRYFLRQDYPERELLVVDDGDDPVGDLVPENAWCRYLRLDRRYSVGEKRNRGCREARGELIAHWDDDDWQAADRLSRQVAALDERASQACGLADLLHYRVREGDAWRYRPLPGDPPWVAGCSLLYRRAAWAVTGFPDLTIGEDGAFVARLVARYGAAAVHQMHDGGWLLAVLHGTNTGAKRLADPRWTRASLDEAVARFAADRDFYVTLRTGGPTRPSAHNRGSTVTLVSDIAVYDGYGSMGEYLARGMLRAGADVELAPMRLDRAGLAPDTLRLLDRPGAAGDGPTLYSSWLRPQYERYARAPDLFVATMWESSRLPAGWPARLDRARAVVVPTSYVADVCRDSGVTAPVEVVPDGVDPAIYHLERRPPRETLTTLVVGTAIPRKNLDVAIAAWRSAFDGDPGARLLVKARFGAGRPTAGDPRITVVDDAEPTRGIAGWYRAADVLLALGNEGFGLPLVEGMATGLPVVALASEGQLDVCREAGDRVLAVPPARFHEVTEVGYGSCGVRGTPDPADVAARLRWVATHRDEARELGRSASQWAVRRRDVWGKGPAVLDVMERRLPVRRPLRRVRTLWVPSWGQRCGVAEYSRSLFRALPPGVTVTAEPPDDRGVRLLHLQHEDALVADSAATRVAERLRAPLIVTEHTVGDHPHPWERRADVLVAHTEGGAAALRRRCPDQRVVGLPHGCPAWFPARKRRRGRVIGTFGFVEPYKRLDAVLGIARQVPGAEVVLSSYPRREEEATALREAAAGLPVDWDPRFRPEDEVARLMAARCDVLVFWYADTPLHAASGAIRVGLATGIPVLASPTRWFADVREATYQPDDLVAGVRRLLEDDDLRADLSAAAREYCTAHSWRRVAKRHVELWDSVEKTP